MGKILSIDNGGKGCLLVRKWGHDLNRSDWIAMDRLSDILRFLVDENIPVQG